MMIEIWVYFGIVSAKIHPNHCLGGEPESSGFLN
jgi:hypothetical protein